MCTCITVAFYYFKKDISTLIDVIKSIITINWSTHSQSSRMFCCFLYFLKAVGQVTHNIKQNINKCFCTGTINDAEAADSVMGTVLDITKAAASVLLALR